MFIPDPVVYPNAAARWCALRRLSHYLEGYPYPPEYRYTETFTSDPHYIREHVDLMPHGLTHNHDVMQLHNALWELIVRRGGYISVGVAILCIPERMMAAPRHTCALVPDLAVWPFRNPMEEREVNLSDTTCFHSES